MVFAALAFGWLLLFLLLPSLYRLFLEFPIRLLMHGIRWESGAGWRVGWRAGGAGWQVGRSGGLAGWRAG